jgi:hypothetical protein
MAAAQSPSPSEMFFTGTDAVRVPREDGAWLIVPQPGRLAGMVERNRRLRSQTRLRLLDREYPLCGPDAAEPMPPVIMTGHQPDFFPPGIWVKNVVSSRLAEQVGGKAVFLAVDSDAPHGLFLRWPHQQDGDLMARRVGFYDGPPGVAIENFAQQPRAFWAERFERAPESIRSANETPFPTYIAAFLHETRSVHYMDRWEAGMRALDAHVGAGSPTFVRVSRLEQIGQGDAWYTFLAHCIINAERFVACYNTALASYREARRIHGQRHPVPDLEVWPDRIELPFWLIRNNQPRRRLYVAIRSGRIHFLAGDYRVGDGAVSAVSKTPRDTLVAALGEHDIRPRALMLTMFARLFCCDGFIHGLGGARYDRITDTIIKTFFQTDPPEYACATATLRLPLAGWGDSGPAWRRSIRELRFNPQRYLSDTSAPEIADLLRKRETAIEDSLRLRESAPTMRSDRREIFDRIRRLNKSLVDHLPEAARLADAASPAKHGDAALRLAASREWFVALYPTEKLRRLCDHLPPVGEY